MDLKARFDVKSADVGFEGRETLRTDPGFCLRCLGTWAAGHLRCEYGFNFGEESVGVNASSKDSPMPGPWHRPACERLVGEA